MTPSKPSAKAEDLPANEAAARAEAGRHGVPHDGIADRGHADPGPDEPDLADRSFAAPGDELYDLLPTLGREVRDEEVPDMLRSLAVSLAGAADGK